MLSILVPGISSAVCTSAAMWRPTSVKAAGAVVGEGDYLAAVEDALDEPPLARRPRTFPVDGEWAQNSDRSYPSIPEAHVRALPSVSNMLRVQGRPLVGSPVSDRAFLESRSAWLHTAFCRIHACRRDDDECANAALHIEQLIRMKLRKGDRVDQGNGSAPASARANSSGCSRSRIAILAPASISSGGGGRRPRHQPVIEEIARHCAADLVGASLASHGSNIKSPVSAMPCFKRT
jgi:hypothetical protein